MTVQIISERVLPDGTPFETTDVDYYCGWLCAADDVRAENGPGYVEEMLSRYMAGTWRSLDDDSGLSWGKCYGVETNSDTYCASDSCRDLLWEGLETIRLNADDDPNLIFA